MKTTKILKFISSQFKKFIIITFLLSSGVSFAFDTSEWLPKPPEEMAEKDWFRFIASLIRSENFERNIKNDGSDVDFGHSYNFLNPIKQTLLKDVHNYQRTFGVRPKVADIGAGLGKMSWKILLAGGQVDAFDIQVPTAKEMVKRLKAMDKKLWGSDVLENILRVFAMDFISLENETELFKKYDFIYIGQVIHFLSPQDVNKLIKILGKMIKPGGKIYVEVNSIHYLSTLKDDRATDYYKEAKKENSDFPGLIAINGMDIDTYKDGALVNRTRKVISVISRKNLMSFDHQMNAYGTGYFHPELMTQAENKEEKRLALQGNKKNTTIHKHFSIINLMDHSTLERKFKTEGGFNIVDLRYIRADDGATVSPDDASGVALQAIFHAPYFSSFVNTNAPGTHLLDQQNLMNTEFAPATTTIAERRAATDAYERYRFAVGDIMAIYLLYARLAQNSLE